MKLLYIALPILAASVLAQGPPAATPPVINPPKSSEPVPPGIKIEKAPPAATPAFDPDAYLRQKSGPASPSPVPLDLQPLNSIEPARTTPTPGPYDDLIPQTASKTEKTPAQIARIAFPSVVLLVMQDARGQALSLGSGFFVEKNTIATNFHVIEGAASGYAKIIGQRSPRIDTPLAAIV